LNSLYESLLYGEIIAAALVFGLLFRLNAPYGRFHRGGWGPSISARWAWFIQEFPAFATILVIFIVYADSKSIVNWTFLILWEVHYIQRTFVYPFRLGKGSKPYPLLLVLMAVIFNLMNGFVNGYYLFELTSYSAAWLYDPRFITGTILFIAGFVINKNADKYLRNLKSNSGGGYGLPEGGLFRWISSPHYFGEIIEWTGWAILTWSLPGLAFAVFTFANLAPRAWAHHRWYRQTFSNYPRKRKALIPFLW